jgi:hypothetical protein
MRLSIAIVTLLSSSAAFAEETAPVPWQITGTSTLPVGGEDPTGRVELRVFQKEGHVIVRTGFTYLARADFYTNPGVSVDVAWYPWEFLDFELTGSYFFSELTSTAEALRKTTGLLPDSQRPRATAMGGARFAFAYGKLLIEWLETVVHADAGISLHAGVLITDDAVNFAGDVSLGVQVVAFERLLVFLEAGWLAGYEERSTTSFASGLETSIGIGLLL